MQWVYPNSSTYTNQVFFISINWGKNYRKITQNLQQLYSFIFWTSKYISYICDEAQLKFVHTFREAKEKEIKHMYEWNRTWTNLAKNKMSSGYIIFPVFTWTQISICINDAKCVYFVSSLSRLYPQTEYWIFLYMD